MKDTQRKQNGTGVTIPKWENYFTKLLFEEETYQTGTTQEITKHNNWRYWSEEELNYEKYLKKKKSRRIRLN